MYLDPSVSFRVPGGGGFSGRFSFVYRGGLLQHHTFGATADRSSLLSPYERASSLGDRALSLSLGLKNFLLLLFSHSLFPFPLSPSCAQTPNCRLLFTHSHPFSQLSDPLPPPSPLLSSSLPPPPAAKAARTARHFDRLSFHQSQKRPTQELAVGGKLSPIFGLFSSSFADFLDFSLFDSFFFFCSIPISISFLFSPRLFFLHLASTTPTASPTHTRTQTSQLIAS